MKTIHYSFRSFTPPALQGMILGLLALGFIACRVFGADANVPPAPMDANGRVALPPVIASSGSNGSPITIPPGGITASVGDNRIDDPNVIARVVNITIEDMRATIASLDPDEQAAVAADPVALNKVVRTILMEQVVLKDISLKQWDQQPAVKARLERVRETTLAGMYLQSVSKPPDVFPSDAELREAYETHKAAFSVPHQFLITQIFVAVAINADKDANDKAQSKLERIINELQQQGADFAAIARSESDDKASGAQGGEMGWVGDDKMAPRIRAMAHALAKGATSIPVRLMDGWHILKLLDTKDVSPAPFDDVKGKLAEALRADREHTNRMAYLDKLLGEYPVTINDQAVSGLLQKPDK
jgi:hypothetical protein